MASDTRTLFLDEAEALFAERGFYGVSIAAIADRLGFTKQALLHHFGNKEKLYGEVLKRISERFVEMASTVDSAAASPADKLKSYLMLLLETSQSQQNQTRLLMRELLDNNERAETAGSWYLKSFLEQLVDMLRDIPEWETATKADALARVYQLLGAINYYAISAPTLTGIFGQRGFKNLQKAFPGQFEQLIDAALRGPVKGA